MAETLCKSMSWKEFTAQFGAPSNSVIFVLKRQDRELCCFEENWKRQRQQIRSVKNSRVLKRNQEAVDSLKSHMFKMVQHRTAAVEALQNLKKKYNDTKSPLSVKAKCYSDALNMNLSKQDDYNKEIGEVQKLIYQIKLDSRSSGTPQPSSSGVASMQSSTVSVEPRRTKLPFEQGTQRTQETLNRNHEVWRGMETKLEKVKGDTVPMQPHVHVISASRNNANAMPSMKLNVPNIAEDMKKNIQAEIAANLEKTFSGKQYLGKEEAQILINQQIESLRIHFENRLQVQSNCFLNQMQELGKQVEELQKAMAYHILADQKVSKNLDEQELKETEGAQQNTSKIDQETQNVQSNLTPTADVKVPLEQNVVNPTSECDSYSVCSSIEILDASSTEIERSYVMLSDQNEENADEEKTNDECKVDNLLMTNPSTISDDVTATVDTVTEHGKLLAEDQPKRCDLKVQDPMQQCAQSAADSMSAEYLAQPRIPQPYSSSSASNSPSFNPDFQQVENESTVWTPTKQLEMVQEMGLRIPYEVMAIPRTQREFNEMLETYVQ